MSKEDKYYTPEEAAAKVLEKAHELMRESKLFKNNTSHEIETGEEPNNDDAECPEYLAEADIEDDYKEDEKRKNGSKKSKSDGEESEESEESEDDVSDEEAEAMEDIAEEEVEEHNEELHEGQEHDPEDEEDADKIIENAASENDKKDKKFGKSERTEKMSSKEDYDLDESGEYAHGSLGGKDKDKNVKKAIAATEEMKTDLKKPAKKLKKFMLQRKMKKAGKYPTEEARRRADKEKKTRMATAQESTEIADREGKTRMATPREKESMKKAKNKKVEKMMGIKGQGGY